MKDAADEFLGLVDGLKRSPGADEGPLLIR
jgi:hypothetical protein